MKLTHFRDVLAVAEMGSLRSAGRHLGIAQPALTRSIREIEHELGVTLFERHAKGVRLTSMGTAFVRRAEAVQSELRRAREEIEQLKGRKTGEVSVGLSTASCMCLLPIALPNFRKRYPDAVLKISESLFEPIESQILDGKIDFWIGPLDASFSSPLLSVERLFENRRMVVARKGHALAKAKSLKELEGAQWVRPTLSTRHTDGDFDVMFERLGLSPPQIVLHARSALVTMLSVANSDLLSILPRQWLDYPEMIQGIVALDLVEPLSVAPMCIARRHDMPLTPLAEHLCDLMRRAGEHYARSQELKLAS
jgi:DNA-binding transcriptional LysR family regulator